MGFAYICSTFRLSLNKFKGLIRTFLETRNLETRNLETRNLNPSNLRNLWFSKSELCVESSQTRGTNCGVTLMYKPACLPAILSRPARNAFLHSDSVINFINRIRKTSSHHPHPFSYQSNLSSFRSWLFTYP